MPSQPLPAGTGTSPLTEEEQQAAGPQAAGVHGPRCPGAEEAARRRQKAGAAEGCGTCQQPARTFMCPGRGGAAAVTLCPPRPPRVPANVQPPLFASRPRRSHRPGPPLLCPRQHRARTEPGAGAALPPPAGARGIWCPSFQQAARQIVKLPEPSEQSGPGTDGRDCGCLRHNLGAAVSAFPQSIHAMCNGTRPCGPG